ncbi:ISAs1 family transposase [Bradyrhizobium sp. DOA9]|uniref:ISAs1 family transposase n=1 Tax=Bradyrhizobium sp. DOA9 TaxID=1126627 RepID=UPI001FCCD1BD|nr:ISAs1 family transposase [Bradyrhizobium sp. DOA9]
MPRHGRRAALPSCNGQDGARSRRRLGAGDQGQPSTSVQVRGRAICAVRRAPYRQEGRTVHPRPPRSAPGNHHAQYQPGCCPWLPGRGRDRPRHLAPAIAWQSRRAAVRYYLLSKSMSAKRLLQVTRSHWTIENQLHWVLDVHFHEDGNRARLGNAPGNLVRLRRLALNILRSCPGPTSIRRKIKRAGWDDSFLLALFGHVR